jgi:hypothetical protein
LKLLGISLSLAAAVLLSLAEAGVDGAEDATTVATATGSR